MNAAPSPFQNAVSSLGGFRPPASPYVTTRPRQRPASETLHQSGQCLLEEALPGPEHAWLPANSGGNHVVELVTSLRLCSVTAKNKLAPNHEPSRPSGAVLSEMRIRPPGSDWLYLKLYGPHSGQDSLIAGPLRDFCTEIRRTSVVDQWFFLRYADPDPHLRLRFRGKPDQLTGALLPLVCAWSGRLIADGVCQKFGFDTYEREVERYGGADALSSSELLFAADSRLVVELLSVGGNADRVVLTVATIDDLLSGLGLDEAAKLAWLKKFVTSRQEVGQEYRVRRQQLIAALRDPACLGNIKDALAARRSAITQVAQDLAQYDAAGALSQPRADLYSSYVHMHCNRLSPDPTLERRALGLLLRGREAMRHLDATDVRPQEAAGA